MPTTKAKNQREERTGRKFYQQFIVWCDKSKHVPSDTLLMYWDETENSLGIQSLYGNDSDVFNLGRITLYRQFFNSYSSIVITKGTKKIRVLPYRKGKRGVGGMVDLTSPSTSAAELEYIREKAKLTARNAAERLRLFNEPKHKVIALFSEAVDEAYA